MQKYEIYLIYINDSRFRFVVCGICLQKRRDTKCRVPVSMMECFGLLAGEGDCHAVIVDGECGGVAGEIHVVKLDAL